MEWCWWVLAGSAIFLIGLTKSGFGSGVGLMVVPMMAIAMGHIPGRGAEAALGLMLPLLIAGDLIAVWQYRRLFSLGIVKKLLLGTLVGVIIGGLMLWWFHQHKDLVGALIRIEIGIESILLVGLHWWREWRGLQEHLIPEPWRSHLTGGFAAVSSTLAHAAGPIVAMYLLSLRLDRALFVGTCAIYFFILNTAKLPVYAWSGQFAHASPLFALQFLPLVVAGALAGVWLNRRMSDKLFGRIVYVITFLLGWYVMIDGAWQLLKHRPEGPMPQEQQRVAIVTGGSRGIGRGIAVALAEAKHDVVVNYAKNSSAAGEVKCEIEAAGSRAHLIQADISSSADREQLVDETLGTFGRIDLLVNNAGVAPDVRADILEASEESFDRLININLKGPYFLTQLVANAMLKAKSQGKIVTISSISAYTASINRGDYCIAKSGLAMMTKLFAARLADHGINVFEIRPGVIETDMTGPVKAKYDKLIHEQDLTPIHRWGKPDDVARAVVAIATDLLPFSTGEVINVDGGFHLRRL
ncbi:MAG TPA: 3-ketoacyl-ACP reductase [Tepidisphaeraceae bacterium]|jgi:NAD(P)-dependent dehydrogenase (short-subunit alcohol dehydrogenase family)/uncharacterized membrane protein YfcA